MSQHKEQFHVISERLVAGVPEIHVFSDTQPDASFEAMPVDLESVYFSHIANTNRTTEATA